MTKFARLPRHHAIGVVDEIDCPADVLPRHGWLLDVQVDIGGEPLAAVNLFGTDREAVLVVNWRHAAGDGTTEVKGPLASAVGRGYWDALLGGGDDPWSYLRWLAERHFTGLAQFSSPDQSSVAQFFGDPPRPSDPGWPPHSVLES